MLSLFRSICAAFRSPPPPPLGPAPWSSTTGDDHYSRMVPADDDRRVPRFDTRRVPPPPLPERRIAASEVSRAITDMVELSDDPAAFVHHERRVVRWMALHLEQTLKLPVIHGP